MIFIILGSIAIILTILDLNESSGFCIVGGLFFIIIGLFLPTDGYEDPILVGEQTLHPLSVISEYEENDKETYLKIVIKDGSAVSYTYCTGDNAIADTKTISNVVQGLYVEYEKPTIEEYLFKAKKTLLTLAIGRDKKQYIIKVPKDSIELVFNN